MTAERESGIRARRLTRPDALAVCAWRYGDPYSVYNMGPRPDTVDELLGGSYYGVHDAGGALVGFFCLGKVAQVPGLRTSDLYSDEQVLDIGLGMRPDMTGKGRGAEFVRSCLVFAAALRGKSRFRLTVLATNTRAISAYERVGFRKTGLDTATTPSGPIAFLVMTFPAA